MTEPEYQIGQSVYVIDDLNSKGAVKVGYGQIDNRLYAEKSDKWRYVVKFMRNGRTSCFSTDKIFESLDSFMADFDRILKTPVYVQE